MSTQTAQPEVQTAIYQVLMPGEVLDSVLASLGFTGLYDEVSEDHVFDYISFGPTQELPDYYLGRQRGYILVVQLDIWSRQLGFKKAQAALARMNVLLDEQSLTLPTQHLVGVMYAGSQQLRDPDEF